MRSVQIAGLLILMTGCSPEGDRYADRMAPEASEAVSTEALPGSYRLDKAHASLIFRVDHLGFSMYTARFTRFDAELQFDPVKPAAMSVTAEIDASSIETDFPNPEVLDFDASLRGPDWLDAAQFPRITFRSTVIKLTGTNTALVKGDLSLHGTTRPVVLDITFNGGYCGHPMDLASRIGFSATGSFKRSKFGVSAGLPPEGTTMGVGDEVEVIIEAEFTGPPIPPANPDFSK